MDEHLWLIYSDHNCSQCKEKGRGPACLLRAENEQGAGSSVTSTCFPKKLLTIITHSKFLHWSLLFIHGRFYYGRSLSWNYDWLENDSVIHIPVWISKTQKSDLNPQPIVFWIRQMNVNFGEDICSRRYHESLSCSLSSERANGCDLIVWLSSKVRKIPALLDGLLLAAA